LKKVRIFFARWRNLSTFATRSGRKSGTFFEKQVQKELSKKFEIIFGRYSKENVPLQPANEEKAGELIERMKV